MDIVQIPMELRSRVILISEPRFKDEDHYLTEYPLGSEIWYVTVNAFGWNKLCFGESALDALKSAEAYVYQATEKFFQDCLNTALDNSAETALSS